MGINYYKCKVRMEKSIELLQKTLNSPDLLFYEYDFYYKSPFFNTVQPFASSTARQALRSLGFITT